MTPLWLLEKDNHMVLRDWLVTASSRSKRHEQSAYHHRVSVSHWRACLMSSTT
jgi:hypothetical protein